MTAGYARAVETAHAGRRRLDAGTEHGLVLAAQAREDGACDALIEAFTPLIGSVARLYRGSRNVDRVELMQDGVVGLLRALGRYDPSLGTPFWAYASWWVRQAMQQLVSELSRPVVLSDRALRQLARVKDAHRVHVLDNGREPSFGELALLTGLRRQQVEHLLAAERKPRGLQEPIGGDEAAGSFGDLLADPFAEDAYDRVPRRAQAAELPRLLRALSDRERIVLRARYGLDGPERTLRELGGWLGVSAERVRQIEQEALGKMRAAAAA